jgi:hypothetical protein
MGNPCVASLSNQMLPSRWLLHDAVACIANGPWFCTNGFSSCFSSICMSDLSKFQNSLFFFFFSDLINIFLLLFVLYEIIYKINFFLISSSFNFFICHIWLPLFWLLFVLFEIIFKIEFCLWFHPSLFFFLSDLIFILLIDFFLLWQLF